MASKVVDVKIAQGQRVRLESPGRRRLGDPRPREPKPSRATSAGLHRQAARDYGQRADGAVDFGDKRPEAPA